MPAQVITTLPTGQQPIVHGTVYGRGKGALHVVNCPSCNPLTKINYATNKRVSDVIIENAPKRRRGRGRCGVTGCSQGFVNVSYRGMNEITDLAKKEGTTQEDLIKLVSESGRAMLESLHQGTH